MNKIEGLSRALGLYAARVHDEHVNRESSQRAQENAATEFLDTVVESIRPALNALSSRVQARASGWVRQYEAGGSHVKYFDDPEASDSLKKYARAVLVVGEPRPGVNPSVSFQRLTGSALYLNNVGQFFVVDYNGEYNPEADSFWWRASPLEVSTRAVVEQRWPIGEIVANILEELEACEKGQKKASDKAEDLACRLSVAASVLGGGGTKPPRGGK